MRNRDLVTPYLVPFLVYVGAGTFLSDPTLVYAVRLVAVPAALWWGWRSYLPLTGPNSALASIAIGLAVGVAATALWVGLAWPFAPAEAEAWDDLDWALRLVGSATLPPIFEELVMRGLALGLIVQWQHARRAGEPEPFAHVLDERSIHELPPGSWTPLALAGSSALFALGHLPEQYPAAFTYGLVMCGLWIVRRDLVSCMAAHAATNVALALWVRQSGHWELW